MRDYKSEVKWGIIIAKEFNVAPDDIDIFPFLDALERAVKMSCSDNRSLNTDQEDSLIVSPQGEREEEALCGELAPRIITKIMEAESPFGEWIYDLMRRKHISESYNSPIEMTQEEIDRVTGQEEDWNLSD
ncbi:MAG: hypothetical protein J7L15_04425 [Clostridiales bacterium]|nr:hypothetical protein [Clostridiales bacterium]